jgi:hypothetical protein
MEEVNEKWTPKAQIAKVFSMYGQDFCCDNETRLLEYLSKHDNNGVYQ